MENAHHILLIAKSLNYDHYLEARDSIELFKKEGSKVSLLKVIPKLPFYYYQIPSVTNLQDDLFMDAEQELKETGRLLGISADDQHVRAGSFKPTVAKVVNEIDADFVCIIGEKNILPGTANMTLHHIKQVA